jgi:shikimate kinase
MNIILIGYRGSGKTTLGRILADQLRKSFVDVDDQVCAWFGGASIAEIWRQHGEAEFRRVEVEVTRDLVSRSQHVIGLGGGSLMQPVAREAVEGCGDAVRIYLQCDPEILFKRIKGDRQSDALRPNLTKFGGGSEEIKAVLAEREPVYTAVADKVLDVTHLQPEDAVRCLVELCL